MYNTTDVSTLLQFADQYMTDYGIAAYFDRLGKVLRAKIEANTITKSAALVALERATAIMMLHK